jgi:hypothetical protein
MCRLLLSGQLADALVPELRGQHYAALDSAVLATVLDRCEEDGCAIHTSPAVSPTNACCWVDGVAARVRVISLRKCHNILAQVPRGAAASPPAPCLGDAQDRRVGGQASARCSQQRNRATFAWTCWAPGTLTIPHTTLTYAIVARRARAQLCSSRSSGAHMPLAGKRRGML